MNIIYKYELPSTYTEISLPLNAVINKVGVQDGLVFLWVTIDQDEVHKEVRCFTVITTGLPFNSSRYLYIDTIFLHNASTVFHIFEVVNE